jgi:glycosyltransferase involved in cell wall biosynthesis
MMDPGPSERPILSVVVPLFNEEGNVDELASRLSVILTALPGQPAFEFVFVNDGSKDGTLARLERIAGAYPNVTIIDLSRNFGHQIAATAGLDAARGEAVVLMDGDLQDPPELIADFVKKWREGYDVVYAVRHSRRGESRFKLITAKLFYRTIKALTNVSIPVDTGDFRLLSRRVVDALGQTRERHRFLRGLVSWVGFRQVGIAYDRAERYSGETKYPFSKMLTFAIDGITSFSEVPLHMSTYLGFITSIFAFCYGVVVLLLKFARFNEPGYTSMMLAILFLGGVQLIGIGILGQYVGRIYDEIKARPLYLVSNVHRSKAAATTSSLSVAS